MEIEQSTKQEQSFEFPSFHLSRHIDEDNIMGWVE